MLDITLIIMKSTAWIKKRYEHIYDQQAMIANKYMLLDWVIILGGSANFFR